MTGTVIELENGKVLKELITEGNGDSPETGNTVEVHYVGSLLNGEIFDSSRTRGKPFSFVLGVGSVVKGFDVAVKSMKLGEKSKFTLSSDYAYGEAGSPPTIPSNADLIFELELISFNRRKEKSALSVSEKIVEVIRNKEEGNKFFVEAKYEQALDCYSHCVDLLSEYSGWSEVYTAEAKKLFLQTNLNLSKTYLKLKNYSQAFSAANEAYKTDNENEKSIYMFALTKMYLNDFSEALKSLEEGMKLHVNSESLVALNKNIQEAKSASEKKLKNFYRKMF